MSRLSGLLALVLVAGLPATAATPITPVPPAANLRVATVQLRVAPDHRDWSYKLGETAKFRIMVTADNTPVDNASVTYSVGPELMPTAQKTAPVPLDGLVVDGGTLKEGGFIRLKASVELAGKTYYGNATAAFAPESIKPYQTDPADFDAFWQKGKDDLAQVPLEAKVTLLPEACTDTVNVYHVGIRTVGRSWSGAGRVYGILTEPKAPGRYPAILMVPGAGVRPYFGNTDWAARGAIVLEIGIHGIPVNLAKEVYDQLHAGPLNGYQTFNLDDRETYYYRRVFLNCLRANDFLASRPMWNGKDLLVTGASQGGLLSIVTAALDPRVTALAAIHPAMCDVAAELHGRAGGWPHPFKPNDDGSPSFHSTPAKIATASYYDAVNFARRLKVPGFYIWGFNDETCPPTSTFAAYNVITAPKTLAIEPEQAHTYPPEQWEAVNNWVSNNLHLK